MNALLWCCDVERWWGREMVMVFLELGEEDDVHGWDGAWMHLGRTGGIGAYLHVRLGGDGIEIGL